MGIFLIRNQRTMCFSSPFLLLSPQQKAPAHTTTWTTASWSPCWCSGRRSLRGRRRSLSSRNVSWQSGRGSWRSWSRRSEIWRTTLTHCWCASWSRNPPSCKCDPSLSEHWGGLQLSLHLSIRTSTTSSLVFSLLCCLFWYKYLYTGRHRGHDFQTACCTCLVEGSVLNVAGSQVVFRFTQSGGFKFTVERAQWDQNPDSYVLGSG